MRHLFASFVAAGVLAGCSDPLSNVARIADAGAADRAATVTEVPNAGRQTGGLFGRLVNRTPEDPANAAVEAALRNVTGLGDEPVGPASPQTAPPLRPQSATLQSSTDQSATAQSSTAQTPTPQPVSDTPRRGLGGLFNRSNNRADRSRDAPRTGPDASDVVAGTVLPFGEIARVCDLQRAALGNVVVSGGGFKIHDSAPDSAVARPFYVTGFGDDCARTFTGAVVIPGDVETHEFVRYQSSNERIVYSGTDNAYEALKANVCRVGRGQPCGPRSDRLNENTYFVTVYGFFGGTFSAVPTEWAQILLHDGDVLAMSVKDG